MANSIDGKTTPMTVRGSDGRAHVVTDMKPVDNRRVGQDIQRATPVLVRSNPD